MTVKTPGIRFIATSMCNYGCDYCHNEWEPKTRPETGLESDLIIGLITAAKELGAEEVDITGGEPLLKIDRVETILRTATELDMWTNLTTNGYFLGDHAETLREVGLKEMHVHVPSLDSNKYKSMMKGNSDLTRVLGALEDTKGYFPVVKANIPIFEGINDNEISDFVEYFNGISITPRFIESMSTEGYRGREQRVFEDVMREQLGDVQLKGSYLWGINEYESEDGLFETLRCICFDRKCDVCPETNFIHVDQNYKVRPCNLRDFKLDVQQGGEKQSLKSALAYLEQQTDVPDSYKELWGLERVPLSRSEAIAQ